MTNQCYDNLLYHLRNECDPDEVVDMLGITSEDLVDALLDYIEDWWEERHGE